MFQLFEIVLFQNNDSTGKGSPSVYDFFKDFVLPILFAVLAAFMSYYIFVREGRRDKTKEKERKDEERNDKLLFFASLLDSIIITAEQQSVFLKEYIEAIIKNDLKFPVLAWIPLNDYRRITNELDIEVYLLAYTTHFKRDRKVVVNEFKSMIGAVDVLEAVFKELEGRLERIDRFDRERKSSLREKFDKAHNIFGALMKVCQKSYPAESKRASDIYLPFRENAGDNLEFSLQYINDFFIIPVNALALNLLKRSDIVIPDLEELALLTRDAKGLLENIRKWNQLEIQNFKSDYNLIVDTLSLLKKESKPLLDDFYK